MLDCQFNRFLGHDERVRFVVPVGDDFGQRRNPHREATFRFGAQDNGVGARLVCQSRSFQDILAAIVRQRGWLSIGRPRVGQTGA